MIEKILFDTDIGDDIDDAFALALACAVPSVEIVAVTTVFKNTFARAKQVAKLLDVVGKKVPVYAGEGLPISGTIPLFNDESGEALQILPCQYDSTMQNYPVNEDAVQAIIDYADKYSGELTVLTIGAGTNLAMAIKKQPSVVGKIKRVVMMGGWFTNFVPEWNVLCDPDAMDIIFNSGADVYAVGLDVTLQCGLEKNLLEAFRTSEKPVNQLLTLWLERWFDYFHFEKSVMHDPLAMTCVFDNEVCDFRPTYVKVITSGEKRGAIEVSDTPKQGFASIYTAYKVDKDRFYKTIKNYLL